MNRSGEAGEFYSRVRHLISRSDKRFSASEVRLIFDWEHEHQPCLIISDCEDVGCALVACRNLRFSHFRTFVSSIIIGKLARLLVVRRPAARGFADRPFDLFRDYQLVRRGPALYTPEEIVAKLRQGDVLVSQGQNIADAIRQIGVSEVTFIGGARSTAG